MDENLPLHSITSSSTHQVVYAFKSGQHIRDFTQFNLAEYITVNRTLEKKEKKKKRPLSFYFKSIYLLEGEKKCLSLLIFQIYYAEKFLPNFLKTFILLRQILARNK